MSVWCPMHRAVLLLSCGLSACSTTTTERLGLGPLPTVEAVALERYLGTWYEIASFPQSFQRGCTFTTATYTLRDDGDIDVLNFCRKGSIDGEEKSALGRARVVERKTNAKLEVSFFRPFWGDYWIIDLDPEYRTAIVGHPSRDYLWLLSRTVTPEVMAGLQARAAALGYPLDRLRQTEQRP
jgi:apolipoprotein D and lipocalin family protein